MGLNYREIKFEMEVPKVDQIRKMCEIQTGLEVFIKVYHNQKGEELTLPIEEVEALWADRKSDEQVCYVIGAERMHEVELSRDGNVLMMEYGMNWPYFPHSCLKVLLLDLGGTLINPLDNYEKLKADLDGLKKLSEYNWFQRVTRKYSF